MNAISNKQVSYAVASRPLNFGAIVRYEETPFETVQTLFVERPGIIRLTPMYQYPAFYTDTSGLLVNLDKDTGYRAAELVAKAKVRNDIHVVAQGEQGFILCGEDINQWKKWLSQKPRRGKALDILEGMLDRPVNNKPRRGRDLEVGITMLDQDGFVKSN